MMGESLPSLASRRSRLAMPVELRKSSVACCAVRFVVSRIESICRLSSTIPVSVQIRSMRIVGTLREHAPRLL